MNIILFDNQYKVKMLPLTFIRSIADIRVGILTVREKWAHYFGCKPSILTDEYLQDLYPLHYDFDNIFVAANLLPSPTLFEMITTLHPGEALLNAEGELLVKRAGSLEEFQNPEHTESRVLELDYDFLNNKNDIFSLNADQIITDFQLLTKNKKSKSPDSSNRIIGDPTQLFIEEGAELHYTTINCSTGPVYIGANTEIMEGASIRGPFALLDHGVVKMGAKIYEGTTIGPYCKVGGELSNVVMFGYSNKAHDGYLGNAVIGTWCNIGAGTSASNLKNDYSIVKQWDYSEGKYPKTGLQFCGLIMGDHSKCGINVSFNTGTVMGICSNVYGSNFQDFHIQSFMIGSPTHGYQKNNLDNIIASEKAMMKRRNIEIDETYLEIIRNLYAKTM